MKIIEYNNCADIVVEFQDEHKYKTRATYNSFKKGIFNPYDKNTIGVGYIGEGKYKAKDENGKTAYNYKAWFSMMERCYKGEDRKLYKSYIGCSMCENWWNLQTFCEWLDSEWYTCGNERMHIDKDILVKGNKVYSPETCLLVPQRINMMFMTKARTTDADLPNGISRAVSGYSVYYNTKNLGIHKDLNEAIDIYMYEKRLHIKEVAEEYKNKVPKKVYAALINW
jgi:hypothetical protein